MKTKIVKSNKQRAAEWLKYTYKMTQEAYDTLWTAQEGKCAICRRELSTVKRVCIDHDHSCCPGYKSCGKCTRGLLCLTCNAKLSVLEELNWKGKAESYLKRYLV